MPVRETIDQTPPRQFEFAPGTAVLNDFRFTSGATLQEVKIEYATVGTPEYSEDGSVTNAFLFCHGAYSNHLSLEMWSDVVGPGKPIDTDRYYIVCPTALGWPGSTAPSNSGYGAGFPSYTFTDIVHSQYRLLTEHLGINRLACVAGPSMGAGVTNRWIVDYPDFMASAISVAAAVKGGGKTHAIFQLANEIISLDPSYKNGLYSEQPAKGMECYWSYFFLFLFSDRYYYKKYPTPEAFIAKLDERKSNVHAFDANDMIFFHNARKGAGIEDLLPSVRTRCLFIVFHEDELCPPAQNGAITAGRMVPGAEVRVYSSIFGHIGAVFDIRQAADDIRDFLEQRSVILFVESRPEGAADFAADLFNKRAAGAGINARAVARCFMGAEPPRQGGKVESSGSSSGENHGSLGLCEGDLFRAKRIISLDDGRHPDFFELVFPGWKNAAEYWDIGHEATKPGIPERIDGLVNSLLQHRQHADAPG